MEPAGGPKDTGPGTEGKPAGPQDGKKREKSPFAYLNMGMTFGVTVGLFTALGYWLDSKYGWSPWATVTGALLGVVAGTYHFLKGVL